jgi:hypothetical protein
MLRFILIDTFTAVEHLGLKSFKFTLGARNLFDNNPGPDPRRPGYLIVVQPPFTVWPSRYEISGRATYCQSGLANIS